MPCLGGPKAWQLIFPPKLWVCVSQSPSSSRPSTPKSDSELVSKSVDRTLQKSNLEMLWLWGELPQAAKVSPSLALPHTMLGPSAPAWAMHSQASMPAWPARPRGLHGNMLVPCKLECCAWDLCCPCQPNVDQTKRNLWSDWVPGNPKPKGFLALTGAKSGLGKQDLGALRAERHTFQTQLLGGPGTGSSLWRCEVWAGRSEGNGMAVCRLGGSCSCHRVVSRAGDSGFEAAQGRGLQKAGAPGESVGSEGLKTS